MADMMTRPLVAEVGDFIHHDLIVGFATKVLEIRPCIPDWARPLDHDQYQVVDPDGQLDWVCAYDVSKGMC